MPGMNTGLSSSNSTVVSAFHTTLLHQFLVILLIGSVILLLFVAWNALLATQLRQSASGEGAISAQTQIFSNPEPLARRLLRISFALIWIFDGVLQAQSSMPLGMGPQVIQPIAAASPSWVQHLDNAMATVWSYHPISASTAAVWIQIGIGIWLLMAPRGNWSRLGGLVSVGWGLVVWAFGEAFGGIFAPGLTWLFGAPGAVLFYCFAGVLIALPERSWASPRLGRTVLQIMGLFFVGSAVLQAWPGRGFWQGHVHAHAFTGTLVGMVQGMATTPQPHVFASWVASFAAFDASHGWAVNLFVVIALSLIGVTFLSNRPRLIKYAVVAGIVICLADWVLVEDFGFFGGVGTDPNSMIPMALIFVGGYLALTRLPATTPSRVASTTQPREAVNRGWVTRLGTDPIYIFRLFATVGTIAIMLVGIVPIAVASANPHADPILAVAFDGTPAAVNYPAPAMRLVDQYGKPISFSSLRGKTIALTGLDPVCTSDCPLIAQEFRSADELLKADAPQVEFVAIDLNPRFVGTDYLAAFDHQENLSGLSNWLYLTGTLAQLQHAWKAWGLSASYLPGGAMINHSEIAFVINARGNVRYVVDTDPGPATEATKSSLAVQLVGAIKSALSQS